MAWGTKPTEKATPFVNELRHACHGDPQTCVQRVQETQQIKLISIAFTQSNEAQGNLEKAATYSHISLSNRELGEIGVDDFFSFMEKVKTPEKSGYLDRLIEAAKSENKKLKFGITVYEDELEKIQNNKKLFPKEVLSKIDRVALYLHYRKNGKDFSSYTQTAKTIFPNAEIYGGVYHYDRRDYISCAQNSAEKCSEKEEIDLYAETLRLQLSLLKKKELSGLELYPGFLGNEASWPAWSTGRTCAPDRKSKCIENSNEMSSETIRQFKSTNK